MGIKCLGFGVRYDVYGGVYLLFMFGGLEGEYVFMFFKFLLWVVVRRLFDFMLGVWNKGV